MADAAVLLRFDVLIQSEADAYRHVATVMEIIEAHTNLRIEHSRSEIELVDSPSEPIAC
jgi:hypothetical protein